MLVTVLSMVMLVTCASPSTRLVLWYRCFESLEHVPRFYHSRISATLPYTYLCPQPVRNMSSFTICFFDLLGVARPSIKLERRTTVKRTWLIAAHDSVDSPSIFKELLADTIPNAPGESAESATLFVHKPHMLTVMTQRSLERCRCGAK